MNFMSDSDLIARDLMNYVSATAQVVNDIIEELVGEKTLDLVKLEDHIKHQQQAYLSLQSTIDNLLGQSKNG